MTVAPLAMVAFRDSDATEARLEEEGDRCTCALRDTSDGTRDIVFIVWAGDPRGCTLDREA